MRAVWQSALFSLFQISECFPLLAFIFCRQLKPKGVLQHDCPENKRYCQENFWSGLKSYFDCRNECFNYFNVVLWSKWKCSVWFPYKRSCWSDTRRFRKAFMYDYRNMKKMKICIKKYVWLPQYSKHLLWNLYK